MIKLIISSSLHRINSCAPLDASLVIRGELTITRYDRETLVKRIYDTYVRLRKLYDEFWALSITG